MKFESFNASLSLLVKTPWREVQNGFPVDHAGKHIAFIRQGKRGYYETSDEAEIAFLTSHRLYSKEAGLEGRFWECVPPVDPMEEVRKRDAEIAALMARQEELERQIALAKQPTAETDPKPQPPAKASAKQEKA